MIKRTKGNGLPFEAVACDDLYGRSTWLRAQLRQGDIVYIADVPKNTTVYLHKPFVGLPVPSHRRRGRRPTRCRVLKNAPKVSVQDVGILPDTLFKQVRVRATERGELVDQFAAQRVWTLFNNQPVEEWLVIRREASGRCTYALSNAPAETSLSHLAWLKCQRYFVERTNQDAKSEAGFDELQAQKYLAWEHHLALTVMATWFVAQTKWQWAQNYPQDPTLLHQFEVEVLPTLSMANVRALLRASMPLPELTPETAASLVAEHLVNRTRSRKSRMKYKSNTREPSS